MRAAGLSEQLRSGPGDQFALMAGACEIDFRGLTRPITGGDGRGAVWCTADNLSDAHLPLMPVPMVHDDIVSGELVPLRIEHFQPHTPPIAMFAIYRKDTPPGFAGRWFLDRLKHSSSVAQHLSASRGAIGSAHPPNNAAASGVRASRTSRPPRQACRRLDVGLGGDRPDPVDRGPLHGKDKQVMAASHRLIGNHTLEFCDALLLRQRPSPGTAKPRYDISYTK
jgi:hypothetical protein